MDNSIYVKSPLLPPLDFSEVARYSGEKNTTRATFSLIEECFSEVRELLNCKVAYGVFPISLKAGQVDFPFGSFYSNDLEKCLSGCESALIFGATLGFAIDRFVNRYSISSPVKALIFDAIGSERVEALCDAFCTEFCGNDYSLTMRFSAGYGDFDIECQKDIFRVLDLSKRIGVSLNDSMLMSPSKSVTAIVGIKKKTV